MTFTKPVKFLGTETRKGESKRDGKPYEMTEAKIFIQDLGRVKVMVSGKPTFPERDTFIQLRLTPDQGSFQSLRLVWDEQSQFSVVK